MQIKAQIIADSVNPSGDRITTLQLQYPRWIHGEFMTHRTFSRNAMSSRAVPIQRMIDQVRKEPALPVHWGSNKPGMQAGDEIENKDIVATEWGYMAEIVADMAELLDGHNLHKQVVNRILEPFQLMKTIVTATEWDNFFCLRLHPDAQPEIRELAEVMKEAMVLSTPKHLEHGEYHLPYVQDPDLPLDIAIKCSVARCARVSYLNHDKTDPSVDKDIKLHDMLLEAGHLSPFEHVASTIHSKFSWQKGETHRDRRGGRWSGNFKNFIQYRQTLGIGGR